MGERCAYCFFGEAIGYTLDGDPICDDCGEPIEEADHG